MTPIRVLLVDDHGIVREGLRQVLLADGDFDVVGEAANGVQALDIAARVRPDVVLLDRHAGRLGAGGGAEARQEVPTRAY
ncbi:MAG: response regulator [Gemmatimonadetes bacterium]|nr:response regulator [Gemmatimonadota bacterium]